MFHKDKNVRLERLSHRTPTRASELATCPKNHRAPKFTPFLTRLPSHFPRGARLISRWLFLFRVRWRLFRLCRAERHSKIARLGFLYPHDRRETKNGPALGTALIRGRYRARAGRVVVSALINDTVGWPQGNRKTERRSLHRSNEHQASYDSYHIVRLQSIFGRERGEGRGAPRAAWRRFAGC